MKIGSYLLLIYPVLVLQSCISEYDKLLCLEKKNKSWRQEQVYTDVRKELQLTFQSWIDNNVKAVQYYKLSVWQVDETVFFNTSKNSAILLVLEQDISDNATSDIIQLILARKVGSQWHFFYKSMNTIGVSRYYSKENPNEPFTFKELSELGKKEILRGGYLKNNCEINDSYVNDWYTEILEKKHQDFLNNK